MPLISENYRKLNKKLHADNPTFGNDNFGWSRYAIDLIKNNEYQTVLDYGCGKGRLGQELAKDGKVIQEYDPAIEGKDSDPEPAELVVCTDVLEHIEPTNLNAVLRHLRKLTQRRLFTTIYTKPSAKTLDDGRNAHLIVKPSLWWREKLVEHFQILSWTERGPVIAAELVAKKHTGVIRPAKRREMSPPMRHYLERIRNEVNAASDAFSQIRTFRMFEGLDDEPADLQGACDVIEHLDDVELAMANLASNSLKCTFIALKVSELHSEWDWRRLIERRFRISQWERANDILLAIGAPCVSVQGITAVGAVASDSRWDNVQASTQRISKRIEPAEQHGRRAIVACYGPSLADTIETLKQDAADPNVDVISVSGAHDFLLKHGITPRYHIECDPRPHKADNIEAPVAGVQYLIASVCHPVIFDKLEGHDIHLWHVSTAEHITRLLSELKENPKHIISGGGSVGLRAIPLLYALGYRTLHIHAMDCSFRLDEAMKARIEEQRAAGEAPEKLDASAVQQWAGKHAGKRQDICDVLCDGEVFISSPVLLTYATNFFETIQKVTDLDVRLYGDGLLQAMCRYYMNQDAGFMSRIEQAA